MAILRAMQDFGTGFFEGAAEQIEPTMQRRAERQAEERKAEREEERIADERRFNQISGLTSISQLDETIGGLTGELELNPDDPKLKSLLDMAQSTRSNLTAQQTETELSRLQGLQDSLRAAGNMEMVSAYEPLIQGLLDKRGGTEVDLRALRAETAMDVDAAAEKNKIIKRNRTLADAVLKGSIANLHKSLVDPTATEEQRNSARATLIDLNKEYDLNLETIINAKYPVGESFSFTQAIENFDKLAPYILGPDQNLADLTEAQIAMMQQGWQNIRVILDPNAHQRQQREMEKLREQFEIDPELVIGNLKMIIESGHPTHAKNARKAAAELGIDPQMLQVAGKTGPEPEESIDYQHPRMFDVTGRGPAMRPEETDPSLPFLPGDAPDRPERGIGALAGALR